MTDEAGRSFSAFMTMCLQQAENLAKDDEAAERPRPTTVAQRFAVMYIEARAQEARHWSGQITLFTIPKAMQAGVSGETIRALQSFAIHLKERSSKFEKLSLALGSLEHWPPMPEDVPRDLEPGMMTLQ